MPKQGKITLYTPLKAQVSCLPTTDSMIKIFWFYLLIESTFIANDRRTIHHFYYMYFKFGQLQPINTAPMTLNSMHLDLVIADESKIHSI